MKILSPTVMSAILIFTFSLSACAHHPHGPRHARAKSVNIVKILPANHTVIKVGAVSYFHSGGIYYQPNRSGGFRVVAAPIGIKVNALPRSYRVVKIKGVTYYSHSGAFYKRSGKKFVVVRRPV